MDNTKTSKTDKMLDDTEKEVKSDCAQIKSECKELNAKLDVIDKTLQDHARWIAYLLNSKM